jgi:hypothetical protein
MGGSPPEMADEQDQTGSAGVQPVGIHTNLDICWRCHQPYENTIGSENICPKCSNAGVPKTERPHPVYR